MCLGYCFIRHGILDLRILGRLAIIEDQVKSPEKSDQNRVGTRSQKNNKSEDFKEAPGIRMKMIKTSGPSINYLILVSITS